MKFVSFGPSLRRSCRLVSLSALLVAHLTQGRAQPTSGPRLTAAAGLRLLSLDGRWETAQDLYNLGLSGRWFDPERFPTQNTRPIQVPGTVTEAWPNPAPLLKAANLIWYMRKFTVEEAPRGGLRHYLRFGAVRYLSNVWLNGIELGTHEGGDDPFEFDVTQLLTEGKPNTIVVRVSSPFLGGIDQHVFLISQPEVRIMDAFARPDSQAGMIRLEVTLENNTSAPALVDLTASLGELRPQQTLGSFSSKLVVPPGRVSTRLNLAVPHPHLWALEDPFLYTVNVATDWSGAAEGHGGRDVCFFRTGFRDFRIKNGYFYLNGKRIFLKSTHMGWYDPVSIQATPRTLDYLNQDIPQLKRAGFNAMRFLTTAALPEQLDQADELGMLIYSEHETAWAPLIISHPEDFGISLNQVVRRDRNHPSLVIWGLLNETSSLEIFHRAKAWLPSLRKIDDTRLVLLSSGRWDGDFKTASASNPGSSLWNVYMGGEDAANPRTTGHVDEIGAYHPGTGDAHIYNFYPTSWLFADAFGHLAENTHPFFLSEGGIGDLFADVFSDSRKMEQVGAPSSAYAWSWINPVMAGLRKTWKSYGLASVYPSIEDMLVDSALSANRQRETLFSIIRSNPKVNGYSLTSELETWGAGEGIMDSFREFKPGLLPVLQAGWAPLRWCLLVKQPNGYADHPIHIKVALANEDRLPAGDYRATLTLVGAAGPVWKQAITLRIQGGLDAPLAYRLFEKDLEIPGLTAGPYTLKAALDNGTNAAADTVPLTLSSRQEFPDHLGPVTVLGLDQTTRNFLIGQGVLPHDYVEGEKIDHEVILVGDSWNGNSAAWRSLYARIACGADAIFLSPRVFYGEQPHTNWSVSKRSIKWLALPKTVDLNTERKGLINETEWLYHKEIVATADPAFAGMPRKLMTPDYYGDLLAHASSFDALPEPSETAAVAVRCSFDVNSGFKYDDSLVLGGYRHHAGHFTVNGFDIIGTLDNPASAHLLLNLIAEAKPFSAAVQPLPLGYDAELDALGITEDLN